MSDHSTRSRLIALGAILLGAAVPIGCSDDPVSFDGSPDDLEYITPEEAGFSSAALQEARDWYDSIGSAAFMALYDGKVFVAWGNIDRKYSIHSIRKPILGALYGIHVAGGAIDTAATLADLGIDDIPPSLTAEEKQARVADLLRSRSGVYHEAAAELPAAVAERPERGSHPPGTFYYYNNWDFNALGTIFEQETGLRIFEEFEREIAEPLGMQDFRISDCEYQYELERSMHPAYKFRMTARDLARFGLLYQRDGVWDGQQIVPADWIEASTTIYSLDDPEIGLGYGMLWFVFPEDFPVGLGPAFAHSGIGVHLLYVRPEDKLVFVHRVNTDEPWMTTSLDVLQLVALVLAARAA
ncbi:MAG: serine hydrolase [Gemmatimonadota bacterium]|nr:MAG: serine hydrolase [Gemmatimonadota bacterium]